MSSVSEDDLQDVLELSEKLEDAISEILDGHQHNIATSSLMNAVISSITSYSESMSQLLFQREIFFSVFDSHIQRIMNDIKDRMDD